jgi:hypothetical protein
MNNNELPQLNQIVKAICKRANGLNEEHLIRRIKTKDTSKGWQWSHSEIDTYFTLEVLSFETLNN